MKLKHTVRETIIFFLGVFGFTRRYRQQIEKNGPLVRVLCFHDVRDRVWFAQALTMIKRRYHILTPQAFADQQFVAGKINLLLTFDDGYRSWVDNCLPELEERGLTGIFFISSGLLDAYNTSRQAEYVKKQLRLQYKRDTLSWDGARTLVAADQILGGHTVNHHDLTTCSESELLEEISRDKDRIATMTGVTPEYFAYPFGTKKHYNQAVIGAVRPAYKFAFAAWPGFYEVGSDQYEIPRVCLEENQSLPSIRRWIEGGYDLVHKTKPAAV